MVVTEHENRTAQLAEWAATLRLSSVPEDVQTRVIDLLIDAIACAVPADRSEEMRAIDTFADVLGIGGEATVIGRDDRRSLAAAVLVNAYRITALTSCDVYTPARMHVTPEVVPTALGLAEIHGASGADFLLALCVGFEIATRVAAGLDFPNFRARGWHAPGVAGPFGSAAAAGRLLGLDSDTMTNALGLAGSQAAGTMAAWGTPGVKFHQARAAVSGLLAGELARTGFTGARDVLTAPDGGLLNTYSGGGAPAALVAGLGEHWELTRISLRPWPGATPLQPVITGLLQMAGDRASSLSSRAPMTISVAPSVYEQHAPFRRPGGTFEAMLSVEYTAAVIRDRGQIAIEDYLPPAYEHPAIAAAVDQIALESDPTLTPLQCRITVQGAGQQEVIEVSRPKGDPDDPASRELLAQKLARYAGGVFGEAQINDLLRSLEHVAELADLGPLTALLHRNGAAK